MSVSVGTNEQRIETFYLSNKQKQGLKYLNSKRIKTHRRPCCADLCMRMDLPLDKKLWKIRTGPPGRRAAGPWAAGRWAAGLLLAKPHLAVLFFSSYQVFETFIPPKITTNYSFLFLKCFDIRARQKKFPDLRKIIIFCKNNEQKHCPPFWKS